jgi:UrcA family protein
MQQGVNMFMIIDGRRVGHIPGLAACAALLVLASPAPLLASDRLPHATIKVDLKDIDLSTDKGKIARDYRIGAGAAAACEGGAGQSAAQFKACVQLAMKAGRRQCRQPEQNCLVAIDRDARIPTPARPNFEPRHMN